MTLSVQTPTMAITLDSIASVPTALAPIQSGSKPGVGIDVGTEPQIDLRMIDLNRFPPDGTLDSLEHLTKVIGSALTAEVIVGIVCGQKTVRTGIPSSHQTDAKCQSMIENALREAVTATQSCFYASSENQSSLMLQSLRRELDAKIVLGFGLPGVPVNSGVILAFGDPTLRKSGEKLSIVVEQLRRELSNWVTLWFHCYTGRKTSSWLNRVEQVSNCGKYWKLGLLSLVACLLMPMPYWPKRECLIEPTFRRYLTSPTDGRVLDATVRPGDVVQPGQLLARIDGDNLRWELAKAEAEYQQAQKKRDSALASRSGGEARLADLEKERIAAQIRSLQDQLSQLEIRSPIAGVVIAGDWVPTAGATVRRADTLFEIAPLEKMRVQTLLSTEDLGQIFVGTPVTLRVDAAHGQKWQQTIQRIDPRGRSENSKIVFYAEADVDNQTQTLKPGMRGNVRLAPGMRCLGWIIFHRPYFWLMKKLAW